MSKLDDNRQKLIAILQLAYSGELAAAYAYRGHWHSVSSADERESIRKIEEDEWRHRKLVGEMLTALKSTPNTTREKRATIVGRALGFLCHVTGWLAPMYGAGKLESRNIVEYETAARFARDCGQTQMIDCLLEMAEVEWDHEKYFRSQVLLHAIGRRLPIWPEPPPKESIRQSFENELWSAAFFHPGAAAALGTPDDAALFSAERESAGKPAHSRSFSAMSTDVPKRCALPFD